MGALCSMKSALYHVSALWDMWTAPYDVAVILSLCDECAMINSAKS